MTLAAVACVLLLFQVGQLNYIFDEAPLTTSLFSLMLLLAAMLVMLDHPSRECVECTCPLLVDLPGAVSG